MTATAVAPAISSRTLRHVTALDGIRGIAIAMVLLSHLGTYIVSSRTPLEYAVKKILSPFWLGVDVFFVLSGFLITNILLDSKHSVSYFRSFYARRALRIFPLYFATLVAAFGLLPLLGLMPRTAFSEQLWYWSYLYNWRAAAGFGTPELGHFWSLAIEEQFYLVWPLLIYWLPNRYLPFTCLGGAITSFAFRVTVIQLSVPRYAYFATPARLEDLLIGALSAYAFKDVFLTSWIRRHAATICATCALAFLAAALLGRGIESNKASALSFGITSVEVAAATCILLTATDPGSRAARFLSGNRLVWLGKYSYGLYVLHHPIVFLLIPFVTASAVAQNASARIFRELIASVIVIAGSCLAAWLSYEVFERRFIRLKVHFRAFS